MSDRLALPSLLILLFSGCTLSTISGHGTGVTSAAGSSAGSSTGSATGFMTSTSASATGTGTGSGTGAQSSTGGSTGTSGTTEGGTTGTSTGDAGPCRPFGTICGGNSECCSGSCDHTCGQPAGGECLSSTDCSSGNCDGGVCACSTSLAPYGSCATNADCCDGISCNYEDYSHVQWGHCCDQVGGVCHSTLDCCNQNCVDGGCACLPEGLLARGPGECMVDSDCCQGKCLPLQGGGNACLNGPGEWCDGGGDCYTNSCVAEACATCSVANGICSGDQACCAGLVCAMSFQEFEEEGPQRGLVDAGSNCCGPAGATCQDAGDCCSQTCTQGSCVCAKTAEHCFGGQESAPVTNDQSCCSGGACMLPLQANDEFGFPICCQTNGQFCISGADCCTENCANQECACIADGGQCGPLGLVAPAGPAACCSGACTDAGVCQ